MERLLVECAVRALLLVGLTAATLYVTRVKDAAAKHRVWTGVMALMLFLPVWAMWGPKFSLRVLPPLPSVSASGPILPIAKAAATQSPRFSNWELFLLSVYLLGFILLAIRLVLGTVQAHRLARGAVLQDGVRTSPQCISPVTVGFLRPVVIFPQNWRAWEEARLKSILTHEEEHARRHDSLTQWFALLNRALFWFHPVAWWLEQKLSGLAEEACDDAVLVRGHNPREYGECLLDLARSVSRSGARLNVVGMTAPGGFLRRRLRKIIEVGPQPRTSGAWMGFVATVCAVTCVVVATGTLGHAGPKLATANQNASQSSTAKPKAVADEPSQPSCRYCPNPEFPAEARKAKISSASVLVEITVSEKGDADPQNIRVLKDPGHGFAQEAVAVVKKWRFNPATLKDGKPTKKRTTVEVQFTAF